MSLVARIERFAHRGTSDCPEFIGGLRAGGWDATWPLVRVTIAGPGVTIAPTWSFLRFFVATYRIEWSDVVRIDVLVGPLGAAHGVRPALRRPVPPARRRGLAFVWAGPTRRPIIGLLSKDVDAFLASVPLEIPRQRRRGFIFWP